jgi:GTP cyclohydrolase I
VALLPPTPHLTQGSPSALAVELLDGDRDLNKQTAEATVRNLLHYLGDDPTREGLKETPARVVRSWKELFAGYGRDPATLLKTFEDGACDEMVVLRGVEFVSFCEHHLLPFVGQAHVAYLPEGKVVGLSKLARLVEVYARRLQLQERLTQQVREAIDTHLMPRGAACVVEASHLCMACRGVHKQGAVMVTSSLSGPFKDDASTRHEFFQMIGKS